MRDVNNNYEGYDGLVIAIVKKAVWDYKRATRRKSYSSEYVMSDCESFFKSRWFLDLTGTDGGKIFDRLQGGMR